MKAYVLRTYGPPAGLVLADRAKPVPADGEVLVRVRATSINPYDWHHLRGEPRIARLMPGTLGIRGPKLHTLGCDVAGDVEAVGPNATRFKPGDAVFALLKEGGFAEYVAVPENRLLPKPENVTYQQAAAVPMAAVTALLAVRDAGRVAPGQKVLINGATGGVGSFAVQIARADGAMVTAVCGTRDVAFAKSLGAADVIDYESEEISKAEHGYDAVIDIAGRYPARTLRRILIQRGTLVLVGGPPGRWFQPVGHMFGTLAVGPFVRQRVVMADIVACKDKTAKLAEVAELITHGEVTPAIDEEFAFEDLPTAIERQERGHARGKIVVNGV